MVSPVSAIIGLQWALQVELVLSRRCKFRTSESRKGGGRAMLRSAMSKLQVTIWNEFIHERNNSAVTRIYPQGLHRTLADALEKHAGLSVRTATLDQPDQG